MKKVNLLLLSKTLVDEFSLFLNPEEQCFETPWKWSAQSSGQGRFHENKHPSEFLLLLQLHPCSYLANPLHIFFRTRKKTWNSHFQEWLEGNIALYSTFYPNVYPSVWHCKRYSIQFGEWKGTLKYCSPHARKKSFPSVNILRAGSPHSQPPTKVLHQSWVMFQMYVPLSN